MKENSENIRNYKLASKYKSILGYTVGIIFSMIVPLTAILIIDLISLLIGTPTISLGSVGDISLFYLIQLIVLFFMFNRFYKIISYGMEFIYNTYLSNLPQIQEANLNYEVESKDK